MSLIKTYKRTIKQQEANRFENIAVVIRFRRQSHKISQIEYYKNTRHAEPYFQLPIYYFYITSDKYKLSELIFYPKTPEIWDYLIVFQYQ